MNTSANIHKFINSEIIKVSEQSSYSKSELVRMLLTKVLDCDLIRTENILIEYQRRQKIINKYGEKVSAYEKIHYSVDDDLCNKLELTRYKCRISISMLLCAAFLFFWKSIIKKVLRDVKKRDNFFNSYEDLRIYFRNCLKYLLSRLNIQIKKE